MQFSGKSKLKQLIRNMKDLIAGNAEGCSKLCYTNYSIYMITLNGKQTCFEQWHNNFKFILNEEKNSYSHTFASGSVFR